MRKIAIALVSCSALLAGLGAGLWVTDARGENPWACDIEQVAFSSTSLFEEGGADSETAALKEWALILAADVGVKANALEEAMSQSEGADRYEAGRGLLFIDSRVVAKFGLTELDDKTWAVATVQHCTQPPSTRPASTPGPSG